MERGREAPTLLFIVGAPAVGKMTVGHEIARLTGMRLFHNHISIEPALRFFDYGTPSFNRIVGSFRRSVLEEVAKSDLPGLIFTYVWAFNLESEAVTVEAYAAPFRERGGDVLFVELEASLDVRLRRNRSEFRLSEKPSKRDVEESTFRLLEHEERYVFRSPDTFDARDDWLRIDTTDLTARSVAVSVVGHFNLANGAPSPGP